MTFFRTREQRQADRRWCEQFMHNDMEPDTFESFGHGLVVAVSIGVMFFLVIGWIAGWLA